MSHLLDGFGPVVADLAAGAAEHFGTGTIAIDPTRRVDGPYSSVLRVRVTARGTASHAFIKLYKPRDSSPDELARIGRFLDREYRSTLAFHRQLDQDHEIGAVRPIACFPQHRAIVTEEVPGRPLSDILEGAAIASPDLLAVAARVGKWVRAYQRSAAPGGVVELVERRAYLDDRLRALEGPIISPDERARVLARFDALAAAIGDPAVPAVPIHADLTPANVIVGDDGRVTVLDFTMAKTGPALHDLSHACFHLALRAARRRSRGHVYAAVQEAMLEGYDPGLSRADPLFVLLLWQQAVCHVAMLAERRVPLAGALYRWFVRRRWQTCVGIPGLEAGRPATEPTLTRAGA